MYFPPKSLLSREIQRLHFVFQTDQIFMSGVQVFQQLSYTGRDYTGLCKKQSTEAKLTLFPLVSFNTSGVELVALNNYLNVVF